MASKTKSKNTSRSSAKSRASRPNAAASSTTRSARPASGSSSRSSSSGRAEERATQDRKIVNWLRANALAIDELIRVVARNPLTPYAQLERYVVLGQQLRQLTGIEGVPAPASVEQQEVTENAENVPQPPRAMGAAAGA